jgi:hypothetical protein
MKTILLFINENLFYVILALIIIGAVTILVIKNRNKLMRIRSREKVKDDKTISQPIHYELGEYYSESYNQVSNDNIYRSRNNYQIAVRVMHYQNQKSVDKDKFIFATSFAHRFSEEGRSLLLLAVPQLTDVNIENSHEIIITKSAAVYLHEIGPMILKILFIHLDNLYEWLNKEQEIIIAQDLNNFSALCFYLRTETRMHLYLGTMFLSIPGITRSMSVQLFPVGMDSPGNFSFALVKGSSVTWEELLPKIKKVFADYFKGGVKFSGYDVNNINV